MPDVENRVDVLTGKVEDQTRFGHAWRSRLWLRWRGNVTHYMRRARKISDAGAPPLGRMADI